MDVPSLMPLPTAEDDGFEWHQRKRRRRPRRQQRQGVPRSPSPSAVTLDMREAAIRESLSTSSYWKNSGGSVGGIGGDGGDGGASAAAGPNESSQNGDPEVSKKYLDGLDFPKGVVNGEGCTAAAVAAALTNGGEQMLGMGWLLAADLTSEAAEIDDAKEGGRALLALERKRRRMREFSRKKKEKQKKLERHLKKEEDNVNRSGVNSSSSNVVNSSDELGAATATAATATPATAAAAAGGPQIDLRPGGRRGRNEALTLRMRAGRRTPRILSKFGTGSYVRGGALHRLGRQRGRGGVLNGTGRRQQGDDGGGCGGGDDGEGDA